MEYFDATSRTLKKECEIKDREIRDEITKLLDSQNFSDDASININTWDPYNQNVSAEFFDPEWIRLNT